MSNPFDYIPASRIPLPPHREMTDEMLREYWAKHAPQANVRMYGPCESCGGWFDSRLNLNWLSNEPCPTCAPASKKRRKRR